MAKHQYLVTLDDSGEMSGIDEVGLHGELTSLDLDSLRAAGSVVVIRGEHAPKPKIQLPGIFMAGTAADPKFA